MIRRPPRSTRTDTLYPYTTLFRSLAVKVADRRHAVDHQRAISLAPIQPAGRIMLVADVTDDLFQNVFQRHQAHDGAVFVDHEGEMRPALADGIQLAAQGGRSEEHTCELQSLMRIS